MFFFACISYVGILRVDEKVEKHALVVVLPSCVSSQLVIYHLVHLSDELVDVGFPVTEITALHVVLELPCPPSASGVRKFERPQEVGCLTTKYEDF